MKFIEVDVSELAAKRDAHRGRVSYPIVKMFMESNMVAGKLDRTGMQQSLMGLVSALKPYIRNHSLPLDLYTRRGEIYLVRLDLHKDGTPNPNWAEEIRAAREDTALPLTPEVVKERVASLESGPKKKPLVRAQVG